MNLDTRPSEATPRWRKPAIPLGLFILALAVRGLPWREVFSDGAVVLFDPDAYYHMRQIAWLVEHFPSALEFDTHINFPFGARPIAAPFFDWLVAGVALPFVGGTHNAGLLRLERIAAWAPPLLGALTVVCTWALAARHFGRLAALAAGLFLALVSGHFWYSQIGFVDHHALVSLTATLLLASTLAIASAHREDRRQDATRLGVGAGLIAGISFLTWTGSLLHVALADACLLVLLLWETNASRARALARDLALLHAVALSLVVPFAWGQEWVRWGSFSPGVLSNFQPWLLGSATLTLAMSWMLWRVPMLAGTRVRRALTFIGSTLIVLVASIVLFEGLGEAIELVRSWLMRDQRFEMYQVIGEGLPMLITPGGEVSFGMATTRLSYFVLALPVALIALVVRTRKDADRGAIWIVAFWAVALCAVTLMQRRFFNSFSVTLALVFGLAVARSWIALPSTVRGDRVRCNIAAAAIVLVGFAMLFPSMLPYHRYVAQQIDALQGHPHVVDLTQGMYFERQTARWLRDRTPAAGGWLNGDIEPAYGVLAPWDLGHMIKYLGQRPVVVDNFGEDVEGDGYRFQVRVYGADPNTALEGLDDRRIRYVVVPMSKWSFLSDDPDETSLLKQLAGFGKKPLTEGKRLELPLPDLERFRLTFESSVVTRAGLRIQPPYRVYEVVPGARIRGSAAPGTDVQLTLRFVSSSGRGLRYVTHAMADANGEYALRVPYPTTSESNDVRPLGPYRVQSRGQERILFVPEAAVREGREVTGPDLR